MENHLSSERCALCSLSPATHCTIGACPRRDLPGTADTKGSSTWACQADAPYQNKSRFSLEYLFHRVYQSTQCEFSREIEMPATKSSVVCVLSSLAPQHLRASPKNPVIPFRLLSATDLHFQSRLAVRKPCTGDPRKGGEKLHQVFEPLTLSSNAHHPFGDTRGAVTPTFSLLLCAVRDL